MFKKNLSIVFAISILIIVSLSWIIPLTSATDTDWVSPANFPFDYDEWGAPEEVFEQDDTYSTSDYDSRQNEETWYEFDFGIIDIPGCPVINGIEVRFDAYGSASGITYDIKLTWNSGSTYTSAKTSSAMGTSDTDTYITVGGSSDTWGHSWTKSEFALTEFGVYFKQNGALHQSAYCDHIQVKVYYTYIPPIRPDTLQVINRVNYCNQSHWAWIKGSGADYTMWRISDVGYPTLSTGTLIYNDTGTNFNLNYDVEGLYYNWEYYICGFSWNSTYCCWSENEYDWFFATPCNHKINSINNNTAYTNNGYEYDYDMYNGYTWYLNYTGILPTLNTYENIYHANGTHENNTANGGHTINVWANYSTHTWYDYQYNGNVTGYITSAYLENGTYQIFPVFNSYITLYEAITDASGSHEFVWNGTHYKVWANYTGTGGSCDLQFYNFSDNNLTLNLTWWGCNNTNTSNYTINDDNWVNIMGFTVDNGQLSIFLTLMLFFFFFGEGYKSNKPSGGAFMLFSGFIFIGFTLLTTALFDALYIVPLMVPFAGFIMLIGIKKWFYAKKKTEE